MCIAFIHERQYWDPALWCYLVSKATLHSRTATKGDDLEGGKKYMYYKKMCFVCFTVWVHIYTKHSHSSRERARREEKNYKRKKVEHEKNSFISVDRRKSVDLVVSGKSIRWDDVPKKIKN